MAKANADLQQVAPNTRENCFHVEWSDKNIDFFPASWFLNGTKLKNVPHKFKGCNGFQAYCSVTVVELGDGKSQITLDYSSNSEDNKRAGCYLGKAHLVYSIEAERLNIFYRAWTWPSNKLEIEFDNIGFAQEGGVKLGVHAYRERNRKLRDFKIKQAIELSGDGKLRCEACQFCFSDNYAEKITRNPFAEVHHLKPIRNGKRKTLWSEALAVLCSNCHRMIHRAMAERASDEDLTIEVFNQHYRRKN